MEMSSVLRLGAVLAVCLLHLAQGQDTGCKCIANVYGKCDSSGGNGVCACTLAIGSAVQPLDCTKLTPKCWLMKREILLASKSGRRERPAGALVDNDGLYNPDCESDGVFKARQCNNTDTCWCVNSAGVRRTDKGDLNKKCQELVRTYWVEVQVRRPDSDTTPTADLDAALRQLITSRYYLPGKYIDQIEFSGPYIYIDLKQNSSSKAAGEVDIADVGYYMEKDVKGDPIIFPDRKFSLVVNGNNVVLQEPIIYYIDEKPHEISMKRLTAGLIAVIVVVIVAIIAGIVVLVLTRRKRGRYEKAEMKEMNEMQKELNS